MELVRYQLVEELLGTKFDRKFIQEVLDKAREAKGLELKEVAALLLNEDEELWAEAALVAKEVKKRIYGSRLVIFAPLYLTNHCHNECLYCGFRKSNTLMLRKKLNSNEITSEVKFLVEQGHKRLLLVCGEETTESYMQYLLDAIETTYNAGDIRRVNINIAPLSEAQFKKIKEAGIGTYQLFQETYHRDTYKLMHPKGKKAEYDWRISAFNRAIEAGIDDYGMGVLFGLYDYRYEVLALLEHANNLEKNYGMGPHTVSVPRWRPALGALWEELPHQITDQQMERIVITLRLAVPYTGIILSTREKPQFRDKLIHLGISQLSAGSSTSPGGYASQDHQDQFAIEDHRSLDDVVRSIMNAGYLPSFCTACYRQERTGTAFMDLAKGGDIKELCQINALLTLKEHLMDYASGSTKEAADEQLKQWLARLTSQERDMIEQGFSKIEMGIRDIYY